MLNKSIDNIEQIERIFGDTKEHRGIRWKSFRAHDKVSMDTTLVCAVVNLKISNMVSKRTSNGLKETTILKKLYK